MTVSTIQPLHEENRPSTLDAIVGQDKCVKQVKAMDARTGLGGRAYWIPGGSGTGKTTFARVMGSMVADEMGVFEIDATDLSAARIRDLERQSQQRALGGRGWVFIVNEAHGLNKAAVRQLLVTLERLPGHVAWIFTTTIEGEEMLFDGCDDSSPLISRCIELRLARRGLADAFAQRAMEVAQREGLDGGKDLKAFKRLVQDKRNNLRAVYCHIESGALLD